MMLVEDLQQLLALFSPGPHDPVVVLVDNEPLHVVECHYRDGCFVLVTDTGD